MANLSRKTDVIAFTLELTEQELTYIRASLNYRLVYESSLSTECKDVTSALVAAIKEQIKWLNE